MPAVIPKKNGALSKQLRNNFFPKDRFASPPVPDFDGDLLDLDSSLVVPGVNIFENEKNYKLELAAPGLDRKDFKVKIQEGALEISVKKEEAIRENMKNIVRREFSYNSFFRSFSLPEDLIIDEIEAKYENGILILTLPKKEINYTKPIKQINVS